MSTVDGVVDPRVDSPAVEPTIEIEVDLDRAQAFGLTPGAVRRAEATLLQGIQVGSIFQEQKVFDVIVQGAPSTRGSVEDVRNLLIDRPGGGHVTLGQVADVRVDGHPLRRSNATRCPAGSTSSLTSADGASPTSPLTSRAASPRCTSRSSTTRRSWTTEPARRSGPAASWDSRSVAIVAAFLLLQAAFRSWRLAGVLALTLPLCLVGGLAVALIDGAELTLGSLIGLLVVFSLATRTSMVLVADLQGAVPRSGESRAALVHRVGGRAPRPGRHVTAALAALMLPFAVLGSRPGLEVLHPMSLVVLGGLVTSALVTLFVLPSLYLHLGRAEPQGPDGDWQKPDQEFDLEPSIAAARRVAPAADRAGHVPDEETVQ